MILILSQGHYEQTTNEVMDWIGYHDRSCIRINGEDILKADYAMSFGNGADALRLIINGEAFAREDVRVVWFRRWSVQLFYRFIDINGEPTLKFKVNEHLKREFYAASRAFCTLFEDKTWFSRPSFNVIANKIHVLQQARAVGFNIPETLITNRKTELKQFYQAHGNIITKCLSEIDAFPYDDYVYSLLTSPLTEEDIAESGDTFFPTLAQKRIEKDFEIRTFYLAGECHSMAIFSQRDAKTTVDFRNYNMERPNRSVPYLLPADLDAKVCRLMEKLQLNNGSIDLIKTTGGEYVFLEVNPVGQFGMVSEACNYYLEEKMALQLIKADEAEKQTHPVL